MNTAGKYPVTLLYGKGAFSGRFFEKIFPLRLAKGKDR
jgi:hypothetical protein